MLRKSLIFLVLLAGCTPDGHFTILGYTTAPPYDPSIRTVYVPIFENVTFRRGIEFDMTRAVIREIEAKTPFKVVSSPIGADTELVGRIINHRKAIINMNQLGEVREAETSIAVEVLWRDLRPGHVGDVLSAPGQKFDPYQPPGEPGRPPAGPQPVLVVPVASFIPELGGSLTSAEVRVADQLAVQIVSMMEKWR